MFPVTLQDSELQWKILVNYDVPSDELLLTINDKDFLTMPYQADIIPNGPVNIDYAYIKLDGDEVNDGFSQYADFFDRVFDGKRQPTTSIEIENGCIHSLIILLARQTNLKLLNLNNYHLF